MNDTKPCPCCRRVLPLDDFGPRSGVRGQREGAAGRRSHCRQCERARYAAQRTEALASPPETPESQTCQGCHETKTADQFRRVRTRRGRGLSTRCRECLCADGRRRYKAGRSVEVAEAPRVEAPRVEAPRVEAPRVAAPPVAASPTPDWVKQADGLFDDTL